MSVSCRICFEEDIPQNLIIPCLCKGTSLYVHRNCLNEWRVQDADNDNFLRCNQCLFYYSIDNSTNPSMERKYKSLFRWSVAYDMTLVGIIIFFTIFGISVLISLFTFKQRFYGLPTYNEILGATAISSLILFCLDKHNRVIVETSNTNPLSRLIASVILTVNESFQCHITDQIKRRKREIWSQQEVAAHQVHDYSNELSLLQRLSSN
jgi:E3 ubiquitin-protein ligase DOA10